MADTSNFDDFEELDEKKRCKLINEVSPSHLVLLTIHEAYVLSLTHTNTHTHTHTHTHSHTHTHTHTQCTAFNEASEDSQKDWVFQNYTFKRFEGLTQRGHLRL